VTYEHSGKPITEAQRALIDTIRCPHERAAVMLMYRGGLRVSEMLALTWNDVNDTPDTIIVKHGKGDKYREVPMHKEVREALDRMYQGNPEAYIIPFCRQTVWRWCRKYLDAGCHQLRHTVAVDIVKKSGDYRLAQQMLGHDNLSTTLNNYMKYDTGKLAGVLDSL
jgi:integrase